MSFQYYSIQIPVPTFSYDKKILNDKEQHIVIDDNEIFDNSESEYVRTSVAPMRLDEEYKSYVYFANNAIFRKNSQKNEKLDKFNPERYFGK